MTTDLPKLQTAKKFTGPRRALAYWVPQQSVGYNPAIREELQTCNLIIHTAGE